MFKFPASETVKLQIVTWWCSRGILHCSWECTHQSLVFTKNFAQLSVKSKSHLVYTGHNYMHFIY